MHSQAASFANGVHSFYWNGTDWSGALVAPGLYTYQIAMPSQGYNVTGVVGVSQPGVLACYFQEAAFQLPDNLFRDFVTSAPIVGGKLSFTYTSAPPVPELVDNDYWSARYAAYLRVQTPGMYRFRLAELDDVARLFVDGVLVSMSEWLVQPEAGAGAGAEVSPALFLTAGLHPVLIEYQQAVGTASMQVMWARVDGIGSRYHLVSDFWLPGSSLTAACEAEITTSCAGLPNCSFDEDPPFVHWTVESSSNFEWQLSEDSRSGPFSAEARFFAINGSGRLTSDPIQVNNGSCYELGFYGKGNPTDDLGIIAKVYWYNSAQQVIGDNRIGTINQDLLDWLEVSVVVAAPPGSASARLEFNATGTSLNIGNLEGSNFGSVFIDDIWMRELPCSALFHQ